ncbi:SANT/Myb-like DNA-binding domain-containing protein [Gracilibacillus dipsosauri]|uniref:SANT/Myb-like DNA-binding domain-containing protein n=1 Tax=Gracilibacillus dipsosauri TaxID=178340 RepID=UPI00240A4D02
MKKWSKEEEKYLRSLVETYGTKWTKLASEMTKHFHEVYSREQVRSRWRNYLQYETPEIEYKESIEIKSDGSQVSDKLVELSEKEMKDPKYILLAHGYDPNLWEVVNVKASRWHYRDKENKNPKISYATKLTVKPKKYELTYEEIKEDIQELMKNYQSPISKPVRYKKNGRLLEFNITDLHLNKLGYKNGEYDHKRAEEVFFFILNDVIARTEGQHFEKIFFIWSHDFFNIDNLTKTTTAGTPQDVSQRFADMYKQGKRMLIQAIDLLVQVAPVETIQVGANHDRLTSYTLSEVLAAWFRNNKNVTIDTDPLSRKYRRFGKCLIGFSHGDKEKKRLGKVMPIEARKDWGETLYAEIHAGHLHSEKAVNEENGVIVRYLSSPSGTDNWHYESGYVGAIPKAQSFIWDKELGLMEILHTPIVKP